MTYTLAESPYSPANIIWKGYCDSVSFKAPMEIQTHLLAIHEATRANGGRLPKWAIPDGAPHFDKTQPVKEDENE